MGLIFQVRSKQGSAELKKMAHGPGSSSNSQPAGGVACGPLELPLKSLPTCCLDLCLIHCPFSKTVAMLSVRALLTHCPGHEGRSPEEMSQLGCQNSRHLGVGCYTGWFFLLCAAYIPPPHPRENKGLFCPSYFSCTRLASFSRRRNLGPITFLTELGKKLRLNISREHTSWFSNC